MGEGTENMKNILAILKMLFTSANTAAVERGLQNCTLRKSLFALNLASRKTLSNCDKV